MNDSSRVPDEPCWCSDGNTYYFQNVNALGQLNTGKIWSPAKGFLLAQLVILCDRLYRIGKGESYDEDEMFISLKTLQNSCCNSIRLQTKAYNWGI